MGIEDILARILGGGNSMQPPAPMPRPNPARGIMPGTVPPAPNIDPYAAEQNGPLGRMLADAFGPGTPDRFRDALAGAAYADPTQPGLTAFAQGAAGSSLNRQGRLKRKRKLATADSRRRIEADDRAYSRSRDAVTDKYRASAEKRDVRSTQLRDLDRAQKILEREAKRGKETIEQKQWRIAEARRRFEADHPDGYLDDDEPSVKEQIRNHSNDIQRELGVESAPIAGEVPKTPDLTKSEKDPATGAYIVSGTTKEEIERFVEALPAGAMFLNPAPPHQIIRKR